MESPAETGSLDTLTRRDVFRAIERSDAGHCSSPGAKRCLKHRGRGCGRNGLTYRSHHFIEDACVSASGIYNAAA